MWKPDLRRLPEAGPAARRDSRNMAIRRRMVRGKVTFAVLGIAVLVLMLGGSVFVSNQVTGLRADIARLEERQDFLEAGSAQLQTAWNRATCVEVIAARAAQIGLHVPVEPGLVLVEADPAAGDRAGTLRRLIGRLGGAAEASAAEFPRTVTGTMVSLHPRRTLAPRASTP
jgi:hypothetical protein